MAETIKTFLAVAFVMIAAVGIFVAFGLAMKFFGSSADSGERNSSKAEDDL